MSVSFDRKMYSDDAVELVLNKSLPNGFLSDENDLADFRFSLLKNERAYELYKNAELIAATGDIADVLEFFESQIRITVAEFAENRVFLHAGVVGWKGKALIIPAKSFQGKTTLVAELVKNGAEYYSDEYAVLDENGLAHPFPKMLSLRGIIDDYRQLDVSVENLGGRAAVKAIPVGMILLTKFDREAVWKPRRITVGKGIMEMIPHTLPIQKNPEFCLKVLNIIGERAIIFKTRRGEAKIFAKLILDFFEKQAFAIN